MRNRINEGRADTLISQAPATSMGALSRLYGVHQQHIRGISETAQQSFMRATVYSARGTYTMLLSALRAFYKGYEVELSGSLSIDQTSCHFDAPNVDSAWGQNRLIEVEYNGVKQLLLSESSSSGTVEFVRAQTMIAARAPRQTVAVSHSCTARLLPFRIYEPQPERVAPNSAAKPCTVIVDLLLPATEFVVPPSYYREGDNPRTSDPFGLHVLDSFDVNSISVGNQYTGPYPLYFDGDSLGESIIQLFKHFLAAGIFIEMRPRRTVV